MSRAAQLYVELLAELTRVCRSESCQRASAHVRLRFLHLQWRIQQVSRYNQHGAANIVARSDEVIN